MGIEKRRLKAGAAGGNAKARRRLRMERLETRTVLSAAAFSPRRPRRRFSTPRRRPRRRSNPGDFSRRPRARNSPGRRAASTATQDLLIPRFRRDPERPRG